MVRINSSLALVIPTYMRRRSSSGFTGFFPVLKGIPVLRQRKTGGEFEALGRMEVVMRVHIVRGGSPHRFCRYVIALAEGQGGENMSSMVLWK